MKGGEVERVKVIGPSSHQSANGVVFKRVKNSLPLAFLNESHIFKVSGRAAITQPVLLGRINLWGNLKLEHKRFEMFIRIFHRHDPDNTEICDTFRIPILKITLTDGSVG